MYRIIARIGIAGIVVWTERDEFEEERIVVWAERGEFEEERIVVRSGVKRDGPSLGTA